MAVVLLLISQTDRFCAARSFSKRRIEGIKQKCNLKLLRQRSIPDRLCGQFGELAERNFQFAGVFFLDTQPRIPSEYANCSKHSHCFGLSRLDNKWMSGLAIIYIKATVAFNFYCSHIYRRSSYD